MSARRHEPVKRHLRTQPRYGSEAAIDFAFEAAHSRGVSLQPVHAWNNSPVQGFRRVFHLQVDHDQADDEQLAELTAALAERAERHQADLDGAPRQLLAQQRPDAGADREQRKAQQVHRQVAVSGAFGKRIGVLEATAFGSLGAALIVCSIVLVTRQGFGGVVAGFREPAWLWLNGVMGAVVILTITFTAPRIGTFATIGLLIAGQLAMGVLIDYLGLFGLDKIPLSAARVVGLVLLAGGALLVLKR